MENVLDIRPYQLMCLVCRLGGTQFADPLAGRLEEIRQAIAANPNVPLRLRCNVDRSAYVYQNPGHAEDTPEGALFNEKRDIDILQRLGLVPGDTRPARELLYRLLENISATGSTCGSPDAACEAWRGCAHAASGNYERGHALGLGALVPPRPEADKARVKKESAKAVYAAKGLRLRPHHLMCMTCFHGGREDVAPIAEDNLFEAIDAIRKNPEIPVTLIRGCCMICPPCSQYDPATERCISATGMALRDQKKDLDVLQLLGLEYGDTLPARELYERLFAAIPSTRLVCSYVDGVVRAPEWSICRGPEGSESYVRARETGLGW